MPLSRIFISIRWKIILLASFVLTMTGSLFIWKQYRLQLEDFDAEQARFRENTTQIVQQLFLFQSERIETLARILVEHDDVRQFILKRQTGQLLRAIDVLSNELSSTQAINSVIFHDNEQNVLTIWGNPADADSIKPIARMAASQELPQEHIACDQICRYQIVLPIAHQGKTIGTIALVSSLEEVVLNLYHLSNAQIAVLSGYAAKSDNPFTRNTKVLSMNGGGDTAKILEAARMGIWRNGHFQHSQNGKQYRMVGIAIPVKSDHQPGLAVISDVTEQVRTIQMLLKRSLWWGGSTLFLGILLLYLLLHPTIRRIQHVGQVLPLLGEEKFADVRQQAQQQRILPDEMDALEKLACTLADQLEGLKNKSLLYASSLSTQAMQLAQERDFITGLLDTAPVLIVSYDRQGDIQLANQYALEACGLDNAALDGQKFQQLFLGAQDEDCFNLLANTVNKQTCRSESVLSNTQGERRDIVWFHSRLTLADDQENPVFLSIGMDISTQKQQAAEIHSLAYYDPLTHLPNRRLLQDRLKHIIATDEAHQHYCALIAIDIDGFKTINDTKGHKIGNWILTEIAKRLQEALDEVNTIVRIGSDEFVVLLEELGRDATQAAIQAKLTGEMLRTLLAETYCWQGQEIHCTGSFGIDLFMGGSAQPEEHLKQAEIALHYAKDAGRNTLRFFDPDMQTMLEQRTSLEADLRLSLPRNQFRLFYQPQVDLSGHVIGAECLLRWIHPERGLVSPLQFIPLAEATQLILPIGQWVLETACQQIKNWESSSQTAHLHLAVNVSAQQFHQSDFVEQILAALKKFAIDPAHLKIELTESTILDNIVETIEKMEILRQHGVRFSMDDFGTGYSSLAYLTQLPLEQLKIDQAFVRNLGIKHSDSVIVQTIINMARSLDMDVLAEGVETAAQRTFLKNAGCLKYQGYLFGRPLPINEFMGYLEQQSA